MTRRLEGVPTSQWSKAMLDAVTVLRPPTPPQPGADRPKAPKGHPALETFAIHPDLAGAYFTFNRHVLWGTTLPHRLRHIIILRVAARRHTDFLWSQHAPQARDAGLTDEEIAAIPTGTVSSFTDLEAALVQAVDELIDDGAVTPATWDVLAAELIPPQLLDVIFTAGCYNAGAWMMNTVELEVDPDADRLPT